MTHGFKKHKVLDNRRREKTTGDKEFRSADSVVMVRVPENNAVVVAMSDTERDVFQNVMLPNIASMAPEVAHAVKRLSHGKATRDDVRMLRSEVKWYLSAFPQAFRTNR